MGRFFTVRSGICCCLCLVSWNGRASSCRSTDTSTEAQRNLEASLFDDVYKVAVFGRSEAIRRYEVSLQKDVKLQVCCLSFHARDSCVSASLNRRATQAASSQTRSVRQGRRIRSSAEARSAELAGAAPRRTRRRRWVEGRRRRREQHGHAQDCRCRSGRGTRDVTRAKDKRWHHLVAGRAMIEVAPGSGHGSRCLAIRWTPLDQSAL